MPIHPLKLSDYQYSLPDEKIAKFPLEERDASKLLCFEKGIISHHQFRDLPELLPHNTLMVFNNTKVIPARLLFIKPTGSKIEIFLLKPQLPSPLINEAMLAKASVTWEAMIGNLKRWKKGEVLQGEVIVGSRKATVQATLVDREQRLVRLDWSPVDLPFVSIVEASGEVPLPPYLNRSATQEDKPRYQTVYSEREGAVAAPTAGLHFTDKILERLSSKGIKTEFLTLHVGAGTFQPIKEDNIVQHPMHSEQVVVRRSNLLSLINHSGNIVPVGTTSMRSLESLYWYGVKLLNQQGEDFLITKLIPYQNHDIKPSLEESLKAVLNFMKERDLEEITGSTEIMIMPGYEFKVCNGLVTNFHQPGSTLILLVAAFTKNHWREIYQEALSTGYRFLSYGDSNLLWYNKRRETEGGRRK
ncbi:MAG TPA: S-adenosylmethionine:tRNA ribosyltransferase-isomerase [Cyclobacteriaceae bacterium]|nr:S-adenosylmethionine:tRNA ribosyltransferase-isomerase [Cyclobacteriaceae bacterium]